MVQLNWLKLYFSLEIVVYDKVKFEGRVKLDYNTYPVDQCKYIPVA